MERAGSGMLSCSLLEMAEQSLWSCSSGILQSAFFLRSLLSAECLLTPTSSGSLTQVAGRLHVEVMRVTGAVPERVVEDDSSENSSESGSLEVVDSSGEIIHRVRKLTCRVRGQ